MLIPCLFLKRASVIISLTESFSFRPFDFSNFESSLIKSLIYIGSSGGIGGTIYCIRGFYQNLGENIFNFNWTWWYIFRPLISVVIGVFIYFFIIGGLLSLGSVSEVNYSKSVMFYCAISFLAGFSFTQFADKLEELSSTLFSKKKELKNGKYIYYNTSD